jgi:glutamine cyclotransferase
MKTPVLLFLSLAFIILSCSRQKDTGAKNTPVQTKKSAFQQLDESRAMVRPDVNERVIVLGQSVLFTITPKSGDFPIDSLVLKVNAHVAKSLGEFKKEITWDSSDDGLGNNQVSIHIFYPDKGYEVKRFQYEVWSDVKPRKIQYTVKKIYKHDPKAYTQGLVYENGYLYEGTGQWGASGLRKYDLSKEEVIQSLSLPRTIFGEGICIFEDKIIQLTWRSSKGFVYKKENFQQIKEFSYFTEGWGITYNGKNLIMSDGSHQLYFLDPEYFTEVGRVEVYDHEGPVDSLNELEYIQEKVFANVYGQEYIVVIDPGTGKVTGKLDLDEIVDEKYRGDFDHVLNGIAYHTNNNTLLVTGKLWPKLYEIDLQGFLE